MPAPSSSLISPALEQLAGPPGSQSPVAGCPGLREFLSAVPDPRDPRGVRHSLTSVLLASVAAVPAGARSLAAIGEWVADAPPAVLAAVGVRFGPLEGRFRPPDEATIRRVVESVDAGKLDAAVTSWQASAAESRAGGTAASAARWRWMARPFAAPGIPPATARPRICWLPSISRPERFSRRRPWTARPMRLPSSRRCWRRWTWRTAWSPRTRYAEFQSGVRRSSSPTEGEGVLGGSACPSRMRSLVAVRYDA